PAYPAPAATLPRNPLADRSDFDIAQSLEDHGSRTTAAQIYASIAKTELAKPHGDPNIAALAAQGQIRCLVQSGEKDAALRTIAEHFFTGPAARGLDLHGRLIAADEQLLGLRLMQPKDQRYPAALKRLVGLLNDYENAVIPSSQRLFLMNSVRELTPA